jgi:hypothetical protein
MTNRELSKEDWFVKACNSRGIEPTKRQASKYRMGKGRLYIVTQ